MVARLRVERLHGTARRIPALDLARTAVATEPTFHDWWHTLGVAHCRLGHWKEAIAAIEKSRELSGSKGPPGSFRRLFKGVGSCRLGKPNLTGSAVDVLFRDQRV